MEKFEFVIKDESGIHARPASALVKEAKLFESVINVSGNGKVANATKIIQLMAMGIKQGDTITIEVNGSDEKEAATKIQEFLQNNL